MSTSAPTSIDRIMPDNLHPVAADGNPWSTNPPRRLTVIVEPEELAEVPLPATRGDCPRERPCIHIRCRHHLASRRVLRKLSDDDAADYVVSLSESCALDVADRGGATLDEVAGALGGLTRERARQLGARALARFKRRAEAMGLDPAEMAAGFAHVRDEVIDVGDGPDGDEGDE